jgi:hypothetical protein
MRDRHEMGCHPAELSDTANYDRFTGLPRCVVTHIFDALIDRIKHIRDIADSYRHVTSELWDEHDAISAYLCVVNSDSSHCRKRRGRGLRVAPCHSLVSELLKLMYPTNQMLRCW